MSSYLRFPTAEAGYFLTSLFRIVVAFFRCGQLEFVQPDVRKHRALNYAFAAVNYLLFAIAIVGWVFLMICASTTSQWHTIGMYVAVFGMLGVIAHGEQEHVVSGQRFGGANLLTFVLPFSC